MNGKSPCNQDLCSRRFDPRVEAQVHAESITLSHSDTVNVGSA